MISAWCVSRSIKATAHAALRPTVSHCLKGKFVVITMDFVNGEQGWSQIAAEPVLQCAGGLLPGQVEDQISGGEETR